MTSASSRSDKPGPDWAAVRQAYVDEGTPVRDICQVHGIHSQTLYRRAETEGWPRRRESKSEAEQRQTLQLLARLRRIAEGQIDEIEARRAARTDISSSGEPERDARAITALAKLIEHVAAIEAKYEANNQAKDRARRDASRDADDGGSGGDRARRRAELAEKLIAMLEQERGAPLPEGDSG